MHLDGTITAPFFIMPESMLTPGAARLPTKQVYVIVNARLSPEFAMPGRDITSILGRTIGVALTSALKVQLLLMTGMAERIGLDVRATYVPETFNHANRGLFDHVYMEALFNFGLEQAAKGAAFAAAPVERRPDNPR